MRQGWKTAQEDRELFHGKDRGFSLPKKCEKNYGETEFSRLFVEGFSEYSRKPQESLSSVLLTLNFDVSER